MGLVYSLDKLTTVVRRVGIVHILTQLYSFPHFRINGVSAMSVSLSLDHAQRIIAIGVATAQQLGVAVCISVFDSGANLIAFVRMNDTPLGPSIWPKEKPKPRRCFAFPAPIWGCFPARDRSCGLLNTVIRGWLLSPGGMPIYSSEGEFIGAIGISGAKSYEDAHIAEKCLQ